MANAIVQVEAQHLLEASLGKTAYSNPTGAVKVALTSTTGTSTSAGTEVSGGSYARQTVTFNAATSATPTVCTNNGALTFTNMPAVTVTAVEVWDSAGTPIRRWFGALTASKTTNAGDTFTIPDTSLQVSLAN